MVFPARWSRSFWRDWRMKNNEDWNPLSGALYLIWWQRKYAILEALLTGCRICRDNIECEASVFDRGYWSGIYVLDEREESGSDFEPSASFEGRDLPCIWCREDSILLRWKCARTAWQIHQAGRWQQGGSSGVLKQLFGQTNPEPFQYIDEGKIRWYYIAWLYKPFLPYIWNPGAGELL